MARRVTLSEYQAIGRMLGTALRHVEIARRLDLSVWTVDCIAGHIRRRRNDTLEEEVPEEELPEDDGPPDYVAKNLRRCPDCGAMVYLWPCLTCRLSVTARLAVPLQDESEEPDDDDGLAEPLVWDEMVMEIERRKLEVRGQRLGERGQGTRGQESGDRNVYSVLSTKADGDAR